MRARRKRQLNYKKYLKQVKKVEVWGGGGSIACSEDKRVSYRRFGLMSAFRPRGLTKGLREIMRSRLSKFTTSGLIIRARDYYPKVILLFVL